MLELSRDQTRALEKLQDWYLSAQRSRFVTVGGYAGTGKTTLISLLRNKLFSRNKNLRVSFVSYTGKASIVLKNQIRLHNSQTTKDFIGTIHSFIYSPVTNDREMIVGWKLKDDIQSDLIIIDEASMVDQAIWADLLSFGVPIIAVGDHGQLPPISGDFNLMKNPEIKLEEIHRQAKGDPIIELSVKARMGENITPGKYGKYVRKYIKDDYETGEFLESVMQNFKDDTLILCGLNSTRIKVNNTIRGSLELDPVRPATGDRVICLRNNRAVGIFNGMLGKILYITRHDDNWYDAKIELDGEDKPFQGLILIKQFNNPTSLNFSPERYLTRDGDLFDYGYAITVHKAQGSQSPRVVLFEERFSKMDDEDWRRWLYTGITRAQKELYIIGN